MIHDINLPQEGPVPLLSLSQLLRQNTTDGFELYEGRAKRIKCRSLIHDLNAVSVRGDDHEDLIVERLPFAPGLVQVECGDEIDVRLSSLMYYLNQKESEPIFLRRERCFSSWAACDSMGDP